MRYLLFVLLLINAPAHAHFYKHMDAQGRTFYSDTPVQGLEQKPLALPALNRQAAQSKVPDAHPEHLLPEQESASQPFTYAPISLDGLPAHHAVRANNGTFSVRAQLQPALLEHHRLQWVLDDQPYGEPTADTALQLVNIDSGKHRLSVRVLQGQSVVQQSPEVTFNLQRVYRR